jgi:sirohydrochlorin ferrochelatase
MPASPPGESAAADVPVAAGLLCFAAGLGYYLWAVSAGWDHTIEEVHRWRQAQTAITAFYLVERPFTLAYETPIYGLRDQGWPDIAVVPLTVE